eukprot:m51a1_g6771 hypothetical protein (224) ;mRNA; f:112158-113126
MQNTQQAHAPAQQWKGSPPHYKPVAPPRPEGLVLDSDGEQRLDPWAHTSDCIVAPDGLSVSIGQGTVVATKGYDSGRHYWEFTAEECGWHCFAGVATRDPGDDGEIRHGVILSGAECGYTFVGCSAEHSDEQASPAFRAGIASADEYELFRPGDRVGVLLDCDAGSIELWRNGRRVGPRPAFEGLLRCRTLYPAFAGASFTTHFTDMKFGLAPPSCDTEGNAV